MILRDYQCAGGAAWGAARASEALVRGLIVLPTGGGKTALALWIASISGRSLWLAHRDELIAQPYEAAREHHPTLDVGIVAAERDRIGARDLVIGSVQTLRGRRLDRLATAGAFDLVVVDEAQHCVANGYRAILDAVAGSCPVLGLTATPRRTDGISLGEVFTGGVIYAYGRAQAQAAGWLVPHVARRVELSDLDLSAVGLDRHGDYRTEDLTREMLTAAVVEAVAQTTRHVIDEGRRPLVYVPSVEVSRAVAGALGALAEHVDGTIPLDQRRAALARHRDGRTRAIVNCAVLTEGYDDPSVDAIVVARATTSAPLYQQIIGRGLRNCCTCGRIKLGEACSCGKANCLIVDLVGAHAAHGMQTAADLDPVTGELPADHAESDGNEAAMAALLGLDGGRAEDPRLAAFFAALRGERDLSARVAGRTARWLAVQPDAAYAISLGARGTLFLQRSTDWYGDRWDVIEYPRERTAAARVVARADDLDAARLAGERYVSEHGEVRYAARDARWRARVASAGQLKALERWRVALPQGRKVMAGEASDLLDDRVARAVWRSRGKREVTDG